MGKSLRAPSTAAEVWDHLLGELGPDGRNVLTTGDALGLAPMATSFAEYREKPTANREAQLRGRVGLFGLSPSDRQRVAAVSKPEDGIKLVKPRRK